MRAWTLVVVVALAACTSDEASPAAGPPTTEVATTEATTTTVPPEPVPLPADTSQVEIGRTYNYVLTAHCGFVALDHRLGGSYWFHVDARPFPQTFAKAMEAAVERDPQAYGISGELHYVDKDTMVLSVPETGESVTYQPTQSVVAPCF